MSNESNVCNGVGECIYEICKCNDNATSVSNNCERNATQVPFTSTGLHISEIVIIACACGVGALIFLTLVIVYGISCVYYRTNNKKQYTDLESELLEKWILQRGDLVFGEKIAAGAFGVVFRGTYNKSPVAIKAIPNSNIEEFENEVEILKNLRHPNLVVSFEVQLFLIIIVIHGCVHKRCE